MKENDTDEFPTGILVFLRHVADPREEWEYSDGQPLHEDAQKALNWIKRRMEKKE